MNQPKKNIAATLSLFFFLTLNGCEEPNSGYDYDKQVVVNGTLTAGQNVDTLKLHWTSEVDKFYDRKALAIPGAIVLIKNSDGSVFDSLWYDTSNPGRYYSNDPAKKIEPTKTYLLYVKTPSPDSRIVTGMTTVPDTFSIIYSSVKNNDTLIYNPNASPHLFAWSPSKTLGTYLPTIFSLDSNAAMIPKEFYGDTTKKDFQRPEKIAYRVGLPREQTNTLLPWVFLNYFGNTRFDIFAIDENSADFLNQVIPAQGGELKEIHYRLNGGIGIFGAKTQAKNGIQAYIKP